MMNALDTINIKRLIDIMRRDIDELKNGFIDTKFWYELYNKIKRILDTALYERSIRDYKIIHDSYMKEIHIYIKPNQLVENISAINVSVLEKSYIDMNISEMPRDLAISLGYFKC